MELGEAQKRSPEALKSLEIDLEIENLDFHESIEHPRKSLIREAPKASCDLRCSSKRTPSNIKKELEGAESTLR